MKFIGISAGTVVGFHGYLALYSIIFKQKITNGSIKNTQYARPERNSGQ